MIQCPKCSFEQKPGATDCPRCGVIFSRYEEQRVQHTERLFQSPDQAPRVSAARSAAISTAAFLPRSFEAADDDDGPADGRFGSVEIGILAFGLVGAVLFSTLPFLTMLIQPIQTLFHEFGHAVTGWLLGRPSIPAFDFTYGGGFTHYGKFQPLLALAIAAALLWLGWLLRGNRLSVGVLCAIAAVWLVAVSSEWRRETVLASAGVVFELIMAAIFLYMAIAGIGFRNAALERPLAAFVAFVVQMSTMRFLWQLRSSDEFLAGYKEGKGGALMNDLEVVALNLHIHTPFNPGIQGLAGLLLLLSPVPMAIAVLWFLNRRRVHGLLTRLRLLQG